MKSINIKTINAVVMTLLIFVSTKSVATQIYLAEKANFISVKAERSSLDKEHDIIKIVGLMKYGNSCKVKNFKFKTLNKIGNEFNYDVFGSDGDTDTCPMIYLPVEKSYVIDQIKVPRDLDIKISVNDSLVD